MQIRSIRLNLPFAAFGLAALAAGFSACNQSQAPTSADSVPAQAGTATADPESPTLVPEHPLNGAELETFLKTLPESQRAPSAASFPSALSSSALAKTVGNSACLIDFNSLKGLAHMSDRASAFYASSPYYIQPCFPYYAFVTPSSGNYYYLPTEAKGTCSGNPGYIGYWSNLGTCNNQQDAALFPRFASNGSTTDGGLGIKVTLPQDDGTDHPFRVNIFFGRWGTMTAYGYRPATGWTSWGPLNASSPQFFTLSNATNLTAFYIMSTDRLSVWQADNISVTPN
jgi:hypothetical protein